MFEFDLQMFTDDEGQTTDTETETTSQQDEEVSIPEELGGLPEEYVREVFNEYKQAQPQETQEQPAEETPIETSEETKPQTPSNIPYARFKEKVDEVNQLKAQLAEYQRRAQQPQQQQAPAQQPVQQPQFRITPEISKKINEAITAEAMALTGFSQDDVASLEYADDDDPRIAQWNQGKNIAQARVYGAIQQSQINQQRQAQKFYEAHTATVKAYNDFVAKEFTEPDFQAIQQFAINDFFEQLPPNEKQIVAQSYLNVERQIASPAETMLVQKYYERAKAAFRSRSKAKPTNQKRQAPQVASLPRVDQLNGTTTTNDGQLSANEIEKLLEGDFTKIDEKIRNQLLGFT